MSGVCWRAVEAQHRVSTMKLVDTLAEQSVLESLVEATNRRSRRTAGTSLFAGRRHFDMAPRTIGLALPPRGPDARRVLRVENRRLRRSRR